MAVTGGGGRGSVAGGSGVRSPAAAGFVWRWQQGWVGDGSGLIGNSRSGFGGSCGSSYGSGFGGTFGSGFGGVWAKK